jgi:hypothetical protein
VNGRLDLLPRVIRSLSVEAAVVLAACVLGCSGINSQTYSFATLEEARQAGAIAHGWLPSGLPPGTHDIREAHVPGTPQRWGIINFPPGEADTLRALLVADEFSLDGQHCDAPARIEWWPLMLRGQIDAVRLHKTGVRAYKSKQGDLLFAVNWKQGRAYYWRPPG